MHFLVRLKKNNNREWFEENRPEFEAAKENHLDFVQRMIAELGKINPALKGQSPKDCIFRIYRDVRFSKNKAPYKLNFGAYFCEGGKKSEKAGFYVQVQPGGNSFAAGGCWMPQPPQLKAIRQEIRYHTDEFKDIILARSFKKYFNGLSGDALKTVPKGFSKDDPDIELYKFTSYIADHPFKDKEVVSKNFVKENIAVYKSIFPMLSFLNRAMGT